MEAEAKVCILCTQICVYACVHLIVGMAIYSDKLSILCVWQCFLTFFKAKHEKLYDKCRYLGEAVFLQLAGLLRPSQVAASQMESLRTALLIL